MAETSPELFARTCAVCGKTPPDGFAAISEGNVTRWFCHPDDGPSCYESAALGDINPDEKGWDL